MICPIQSSVSVQFFPSVFRKLYQSCSEAHQGLGGGLSVSPVWWLRNEFLLSSNAKVVPHVRTWFINTLYSVILSSIKGDYLLWKRVLQVSVFILTPENSPLWMLPGDCLQIMYNLDEWKEKQREQRLKQPAWANTSLGLSAHVLRDVSRAGLLEAFPSPAWHSLACHSNLEGGGRGSGLSSERPLGRTGYISLGVQCEMKTQGPCQKIIKNLKTGSTEL